MESVFDFGAVFKQLAAADEPERSAALGGVEVRLVRVKGGGPGRWDSHDDTAETVVVWSGMFEVAFEDRTLRLGPGQCCVVPLGVRHKGTSPTGAEVVLFKTLPAA